MMLHSEQGLFTMRQLFWHGKNVLQTTCFEMQSQIVYHSDEFHVLKIDQQIFSTKSLR